ncbi:hypothetical protein [Streptomyces sp. enrichment culture]|uniref:hypothetical protein n=1 Tax=Streptomyces sp. enrichment culture TaxID=1795815 RepID=UPI003F56B84A
MIMALSSGHETHRTSGIDPEASLISTPTAARDDDVAERAVLPVRGVWYGGGSADRDRSWVRSVGFNAGMGDALWDRLSIEMQAEVECSGAVSKPSFFASALNQWAELA